MTPIWYLSTIFVVLQGLDADDVYVLNSYLKKLLQNPYMQFVESFVTFSV